MVGDVWKRRGVGGAPSGKLGLSGPPPDGTTSGGGEAGTLLRFSTSERTEAEARGDWVVTAK